MKEGSLEKSASIRKLLTEGLQHWKEQRALESLKEGKVTFLKAAEMAGCSVWDFEGLEDEGKLAIIDACSTKIGIPSHEKYIDVRPFDLRSMMDQIIAAQDAIGAKRALIDSTTTIGFYLQEPAKIRIELLKLANTLDVLGLTSILTCELLEDAIGNSRFGVEQFIVDGIIRLNSKRDGDAFYKEISIIKMRGSQHSNNIHPFVITPKGIVVQVKQSENLE